MSAVARAVLEVVFGFGAARVDLGASSVELGVRFCEETLSTVGCSGVASGPKITIWSSAGVGDEHLPVAASSATPLPAAQIARAKALDQDACWGVGGDARGVVE